MKVRYLGLLVGLPLVLFAMTSQADHNDRTALETVKIDNLPALDTSANANNDQLNLDEGSADEWRGGWGGGWGRGWGGGWGGWGSWGGTWGGLAGFYPTAWPYFYYGGYPYFY